MHKEAKPHNRDQRMQCMLRVMMIWTMLLGIYLTVPAQVLEIDIVQGKNKIEAQDHVFNIQKGPFSFVLTQYQGGDLWVNACSNDQFAKLVEKNTPLSRYQCFGEGRLEAEYYGIKHKSISLSEESYANWHYRSREKMEIHSVKEKKGRRIFTREVENLVQVNSVYSRRKMPIADYSADSFYIIFVKKDERGNTILTDYYKINFTGPYVAEASNKTKRK